MDLSERPMDDLEQLARIMSEVETNETKKRRTERLTAILRSKQTSTKPQAPPCGLFEQRQEELCLRLTNSV